MTDLEQAYATVRKQRIHLFGKDGIRRGEPAPSPEEIAHARAMGVWADPIWATHDEIIARIQNAFSRISKEAVANAFIAGLGQRRVDLRTYIAGWAMAKHLPTHKAAYLSEDLPCSVCCLARGRDGSETVELDFTHYRLNRYDYGALGLFESVMVNLEDFPGDIEPTDQDRAALASLLDFLRLLPPRLKPRPDDLASQTQSPTSEFSVLVNRSNKLLLLIPESYSEAD